MTFLELLLAVIFLMCSLAFLFSLFTYSSRGTLDAYRETIAFELANEALEWVAGLGHGPLRAMVALPNNDIQLALGLGSWQPVRHLVGGDGAPITYPDDFRLFERMVEVVPRGDRLTLVKVSVRSNDAYFRRGMIVLERLVGAEDD